MSCKKFSFLNLLITISAVFLISGCATKTPKIPIFWDPGFAEMSVKSITIMPIVDRRADKSFELDAEDIIDEAKSVLEKKGYAVKVADSFKPGETISNEGILEMESAELASLGAQDAQYLLYVYIEDAVSSYKVMAHTFKIEATASLLSKERKSEIWRDKGLGQAGQGGLISGLVKGLNEGAGVEICMRNMLESLPVTQKQ
jgi:hypothetical protein